MGVNGSDIDELKNTYAGDGELNAATNVVVYSNIFQDSKLFCCEYEDISRELSEEMKEAFNLTIKVQLLLDEEKSILQCNLKMVKYNNNNN